MSDNFTVDVAQHAEYTLVRPIGSGNLDAAQVLTEKLRTVFNDKPRRVIVDLGQLGYLSSMVLGALMTFVDKRQQQGLITQFINPQPDVQRVIKVSNLQRFFNVFPDVQSALAE